MGARIGCGFAGAVILTGTLRQVRPIACCRGLKTMTAARPLLLPI